MLKGLKELVLNYGSEKRRRGDKLLSWERIRETFWQYFVSEKWSWNPDSSGEETHKNTHSKTRQTQRAGYCRVGLNTTDRMEKQLLRGWDGVWRQWLKVMTYRKTELEGLYELAQIRRGKSLVMNLFWIIPPQDGQGSGQADVVTYRVKGKSLLHFHGPFDLWWSESK